MSGVRIPWWAWAWPTLAWLILLLEILVGGDILVAIGAVALAVTVYAAVYHAEVIAHRIGEPFGTLVLAVAVTTIEVVLIVMIMIAPPRSSAGLARDAVFAAVMIACNGIVGLSLLWGGARYHEQDFHVQGASAALAVLAALTMLTMIMPNATSATPGPTFSVPQLIFAGIVSLVLYGSYVFVQTVRHRDYFLPVGNQNANAHAIPPSNATSALSLVLLLVSLVAVVALAKSLTPTLEATVHRLGIPDAVTGIVIAGLVLLPEGLAAQRAARANQLQTSLNLALGSALASIGLTIPTVAVVSIVFGLPLELGLERKDEILLILTLIVGVITLGTGRTTVLQGIVHLVVLAVFLFFAVVP